MTEWSFPFADQDPDVTDGRPITDAETRQWHRAMFLRDTPATRFLVPGAGNMLAVTAPAANTIRVNTGAAMVDGFGYLNDASVDLAVNSAPAGTSRRDRVILQADWAAYTVRLEIKEGAVGAVPALTQTRGTIWEVVLAWYDVDDVGAITNLTSEITDDAYCAFGTIVTTAMLATGVLSADAAGRAKMATGYFDAATVLAKFAAAAFAADSSTRALFGDGIWTNAKLATDCKRIVGELMDNPAASLGGSDGRRMVVGGIAYESWVHCDGGASVNGVTIPDYRDKALAGASATNAAGSTAGADTQDLSHDHEAGSLVGPYHRHGPGDLRTPYQAPGGIANTYAALGDVVEVFDPRIQHLTLINNTAYAGNGDVEGTSAVGGSATQDMRQATAYVYRFIYVG